MSITSVLYLKDEVSIATAGAVDRFLRNFVMLESIDEKIIWFIPILRYWWFIVPLISVLLSFGTQGISKVQLLKHALSPNQLQRLVLLCNLHNTCLYLLLSFWIWVVTVQFGWFLNCFQIKPFYTVWKISKPNQVISFSKPNQTKPYFMVRFGFKPWFLQSNFQTS